MPEFKGFDPKVLVKPLRDAFKEANLITGRRYTQEITSNKWDWPNPPSPRDIVDTTQLRDSYKPKIEATRAEHLWTAEHAIYVHEGYTLKKRQADGSYVPGFVGPPRKWTIEPTRGFPKLYAETARRVFRKWRG